MSRKHESAIVAKLQEVYPNEKVQLQSGSGNQPGKPNDISVGTRAYIECKATSADSIALKHAWLKRLRMLSLQGARRCMLAIRFGNAEPWVRDFYVVDSDFLEHLLKCERIALGDEGEAPL